MMWSACEVAGSLAQGSCLCTDIITRDDPELVVKDALDVHKVYVS